MTYAYSSSYSSSSYPPSSTSSSERLSFHSGSTSQSSYPCSSPYSLSEQSKHALAMKLRQGLNAWANMPAGFPFRMTIYRSQPTLSYESYEFQEDIWTSGGHCIRIKLEYTKSTAACGSQKYFSWKIYPIDTRLQHSQTQYPVAQVQVSPSVMDSAYGRHLRHDPRVIFSALALSVELGGQVITMCEGKSLRSSKRFTLRQSSKCPGPFFPNSILYIATDNTGISEVIHQFCAN